MQFTRRLSKFKLLTRKLLNRLANKDRVRRVSLILMSIKELGQTNVYEEILDYTNI